MPSVPFDVPKKFVDTAKIKFARPITDQQLLDILSAWASGWAALPSLDAVWPAISMKEPAQQFWSQLSASAVAAVGWALGIDPSQRKPDIIDALVALKTRPLRPEFIADFVDRALLVRDGKAVPAPAVLPPLPAAPLMSTPFSGAPTSSPLVLPTAAAQTAAAAQAVAGAAAAGAANGSAASSGTGGGWPVVWVGGGQRVFRLPLLCLQAVSFSHPQC